MIIMGTLASQIVWQTPASGNTSIQVSDWSPFVGGCGTDYNLSVLQGALIASTPTSTLVNKTVKISGNCSSLTSQSISISIAQAPLPLLQLQLVLLLLMTSFTMPQATLGAHTIYAVGQTSQRVAITSEQVLPNAVLSKTSGIQGSKITLTGYGFLQIVHHK